MNKILGEQFNGGTNIAKTKVMTYGMKKCSETKHFAERTNT